MKIGAIVRLVQTSGYLGFVMLLAGCQSSAELPRVVAEAPVTTRVIPENNSALVRPAAIVRPTEAINSNGYGFPTIKDEHIDINRGTSIILTLPGHP